MHYEKDDSPKKTDKIRFLALLTHPVSV